MFNFLGEWNATLSTEHVSTGCSLSPGSQLL
jgi:hypothetical protein